VNLSNDGSNGGFLSGTSGNICVNAYTFDPQEEEIACCSCLVTPDGLNSLSVTNDLINNTLTSATSTSVTIALVASVPGNDPNTQALNQCNPGGIPLPGIPPTATAAGLLAWGTTLEPATVFGQFGVLFDRGRYASGSQTINRGFSFWNVRSRARFVSRGARRCSSAA